MVLQPLISLPPVINFLQSIFSNIQTGRRHAVICHISITAKKAVPIGRFMLLFPLMSAGVFRKRKLPAVKTEEEVFMAKCKKTLRWHPAFYAGMQIELQEDAGRLEFKAEHALGSEPVRADLLIIKKTDDRPLKKTIGKIFRTHNIVEYKSPGHSLTIDAFYKACGYVNLYKAVTGGADEVRITDMTLTLVCSCYPGKLISHLEKVRGYSIREGAPGVYYVNGDVIPIQIVLVRRLPEEESRWLRSLTNRMTEKEEISRLLENYEGHKADPLYRTVMDLVVRANWKRFEEVRTEMCDALVELMED